MEEPLTVSELMGATVRGHQQNERIGSQFRDDGAQRITAGGCVIVQQATNDPVFGLGFAVEEQNLAWTGHFAGPPKLEEQEYGQSRSSALFSINPSPIESNRCNSQGHDALVLESG
jgi:hypothetical protein